MKNRKCNEEVKNAYMTLEAVLVLPIVMGALISVLTIFIFQYNRCLLEQDLAIISVLGSTKNTNDERQQEELRNRIESIYEDKYVLWKTEALKVEETPLTFRIEGEGTVGMSEPLHVRVEYGFNKLNPVDYIRTIERWQEMLE